MNIHHRPRTRAVTSVRMRLAGSVLTGLIAACTSRSAPSPVVPTPVTPATTPSPPGMFTLSGTVTESGAGPLQGVNVTTSVGRSATTDANGAFSVPSIALPVLSFSKAGYESLGPFGPYAMRSDLSLNVHLARVISIAAGQSLSDALFPDDNIYLLGSAATEGPYCGSPCKLIRVSAPTAGEFAAQVTWPPSNTEFQLWIVQGRAEFDAIEGRGAGDATVQKHVQQGEVQVYFGLPAKNGFVQSLGEPLSFQLNTSLAP
jgi:hypothetical protein